MAGARVEKADLSETVKLTGPGWLEWGDERKTVELDGGALVVWGDPAAGSCRAWAGWGTTRATGIAPVAGAPDFTVWPVYGRDMVLGPPWVATTPATSFPIPAGAATATLLPA